MKASKNKLSKILLSVFIIMLLGSLFYVVYQKMIIIPEGEQEVEITIPDNAVKISIINGCGYPGIATQVKDKLMVKGKIDVISWRNNTRNMFIYKQTIIIAKRDDPEKLAYLQHITGIPHRTYVYNSDSIEDFYIVLGHDYTEYFD
jgi:hypothetical protein